MNIGHAFAGLNNRTALVLTSLGILFCSVLLSYSIRRLSGSKPGGPEPCVQNCTVYASPSGNDGNAGTDPSSPKTFQGAARAARPGSVVCVLAGTYNLSSSFIPPASGNPSHWIVYKSCGDGPVNFVWTGPADASPMFKMGEGHFPQGPSYLEFSGFNLDGQGNAADGFFCRGGHHLRFVSNSISSTGGSGIASINCDYLTVDHNVMRHNGYIPSSTTVPQWYSWTSGISLNSNQWYDHYAGFHNVIAGNIVTDEVDQSPHHTDGNGIILDLSNGSYDYSSANTPPALIINNVVYENGGHCIEAYTVTQFWIVNNTCYMNDIDPAMNDAGSITASNARDGYVINNISVSWRGTHPPYDQQNKNAEIRYYSNLFSGGPIKLRDVDSSRFIESDPLFLHPPTFELRTASPNESTLPPAQLGSGLTLSPASPALRKGIDPSTLPNLSEAISADLKKYIYADIVGNRRPKGGPFDLGAYESHSTP